MIDPFTMPAEIVGILSATGTLPSVQHRRGSRRERRDAYLAYQREAYRFMTGINHLSFLAQIKTITWREKGCAIVTMVPSFVEFVLPAEPSINPAILNVQDMARGLATLAKAASPLATSAIESARVSDVELRNRALVDIAAVREATGDFMAALATVRLIGRPCSLAAADVIRVLFQDLIENIPTQQQQSIYMRLLARKKDEPTQAQEFAYRINALGKALTQFQSVVQADHLERTYPWQLWRHNTCEVRSAKELLTEARKDATTSERSRLPAPSVPSPPA
jgi:hypothetical protein